jgi:hypothetical protein
MKLIAVVYEFPVKLLPTFQDLFLDELLKDGVEVSMSRTSISGYVKVELSVLEAYPIFHLHEKMKQGRLQDFNIYIKSEKVPTYMVFVLPTPQIPFFFKSFEASNLCSNVEAKMSSIPHTGFVTIVLSAPDFQAFELSESVRTGKLSEQRHFLVDQI